VQRAPGIPRTLIAHGAKRSRIIRAYRAAGSRKCASNENDGLKVLGNKTQRGRAFAAATWKPRVKSAFARLAAVHGLPFDAPIFYGAPASSHHANPIIHRYQRFGQEARCLWRAV
jgi:hypothetical protein